MSSFPLGAPGAKKCRAAAPTEPAALRRRHSRCQILWTSPPTFAKHLPHSGHRKLAVLWPMAFATRGQNGEDRVYFRLFSFGFELATRARSDPLLPFPPALAGGGFFFRPRSFGPFSNEPRKFLFPTPTLDDDDDGGDGAVLPRRLLRQGGSAVKNGKWSQP